MRDPAGRQQFGSVSCNRGVGIASFYDTHSSPIAQQPRRDRTLCLAPVLSRSATPYAHPVVWPSTGVHRRTPAGEGADGWLAFIAIDEDGDYAFHGCLEGEEAFVFATIETTA